MALPDILFKGVPRKFTRGYTAEVIRQVNPSRVIIPCVGAYALASTAVQAGVRPDAIEACDISLYTNAIGYMLSGKEMRLRAVGRWEWLNAYMTDAVGKVAAVALAIRILQYEAKRDSLYVRERIREITERQDVYIKQLRDVAERTKSTLGGLKYESEDMWALLERHINDGPETLILCNPPRYSGGYDKMYAGVDDAFDWDQPSVAQFDESHYARLMDYLRHGPRVLLYYATPVKTGEDPADAWGAPWRSVFAARPKTGATAAINWIVTNKSDEKEKLQRSDIEEPVHAKYKLFSEGEITPTTDLRVQVESKEVASYYRDLFVHNLGLANAERYKVLLLDGKLLASVGLHLQNLRASGSMQGVAKLRYAFSVRHPDYPKLHKLTMMSIVSSWFWEGEISDIEPMPRAVQTTMLTPHPEVKTARGIFRLVGREKDKESGQNKLTYYADLIHRTPQQTVEEWLKRWGK